MGLANGRIHSRCVYTSLRLRPSLARKKNRVLKKTGKRVEVDTVGLFTINLSLNGGLSIDLLGRGNAFFGLGEVSLDGVTLRSARRPSSLKSAILTAWSCSTIA